MKLIGLFYICLLILLACNKKQVCTRQNVHVPVQLGFVGFTETELDTITIDQYLAGNTFNTLIHTNTIISNGFTVLGDTILMQVVDSTVVFAGLYDGFDYQVTLQGGIYTYRVTGIINEGKSSSYTTEGNCPNGLYEYSTPGKGFVNGQAAQYFYYNPNNIPVFTPVYYLLHK